jgi:uncharacterized protein YyaL (SSP411 family)
VSALVPLVVLASLLVAAGLVALGFWMGSRASQSILEAMQALDQVATSSNSTLAQVTLQAASAMNDPRMLNTLQSVSKSSETSAKNIQAYLGRLETSMRETREATMMLHGTERSRVERDILRNPSPKPVITVDVPEPPSTGPRGGWGVTTGEE